MRAGHACSRSLFNHLSSRLRGGLACRGRGHVDIEVEHILPPAELGV